MDVLMAYYNGVHMWTNELRNRVSVHHDWDCETGNEDEELKTLCTTILVFNKRKPTTER